MKSLHPVTRKIRKGYRRKGIMWEYNLDGGAPERLKGFWKRYWRKWKARNLSKLA